VSYIAGSPEKKEEARKYWGTQSWPMGRGEGMVGEGQPGQAGVGGPSAAPRAHV
jgi:hypothetical protein